MAEGESPGGGCTAAMTSPGGPLSYPSVTDRYYTKRYRVNGRVTGEDHCVMFHSNKLCVVTVAPSHPVLRDNKHVTKVEYNLGKGCDRLQNKAVGKSKKGAQVLTENSPLCELVCTDDSRYTVYSCVKGSLLEINDRLLDHPELVMHKPDSDGYIAIILRKLKDVERDNNHLITHEDYEQFIEKKSASETITLQTEPVESSRRVVQTE